MAVATPDKHNITIGEDKGDLRVLVCSCGWAPKSPILKQFVPAIIERHTQMNRGV